MTVSFRLIFGNVFGKMTLSTKFVEWETPETEGTEISFMYFSLGGPRCRWAINIEMNLKLGEMMWTGNHKDTFVNIQPTDTQTHTHTHSLTHSHTHTHTHTQNKDVEVLKLQV
jgi:hypothetical protein